MCYNFFGDNMERIARNHEVIKYLRELLKVPKNKECVATDDFEVLTLALRYNLEISHLIYSYEEEYFDDGLALLSKLKAKAINIYEISNATAKGLSTKENHAAIFAIIKFKKYTFNDLNNASFLMILDRLEIPGNVGTILRTLDACGADGVILVDAVSKINHPKITASSRGVNLSMNIVDASYKETLQWLLKNNYTIFLGEPLFGKSYQEYDYKGKIAIVVGNERYGIQQDWYQHPHQKVYIPMVGNNNSINVSIAASILAYEAAMKKDVFKRKIPIE